ncbi:MAG: hypothetical protein E5W19_15295 [Mesorhizobium sp.]|nr:MAG: hypothetical protein E5W19_15295 [Mesorhizobium sp.]
MPRVSTSVSDELFAFLCEEQERTGRTVSELIRLSVIQRRATLELRKESLRMTAFAIKLSDGTTVDHLDWQNAQEQVLHYGATWVDYGAALAAISEARAGTRKPGTHNAKVDA